MPTRTTSRTRSKNAPSAAARPQAARQLVVCRADGQFKSTVNPEDISEIIQGKGQFVWLDIQDPQDGDIALLRDEFKFHPLAIEDATKHHERPKIESYENYYLLVFYAISYDQEKNRLLSEPMNLFIGSNYFVSVHKGEIKAID